MSLVVRAPVLVPGLATGIGSLPHTDPEVAAAASLDITPRLPAIPQLVRADPRAGLVAQFAGALPEVVVLDDATIRVSDGVPAAPPRPGFEPPAHAGLRAFLALAAARDEPPVRVKGQIVGPLTLGVALQRAGLDRDRAFRRAAEAVGAWVLALEGAVADALPGTGLLCFLDESALVLWRRGEGPLDRESAVDLLSGTLAIASAVTGVHTCGDADRRIAIEAGPAVLALEPHAGILDDADALSRFLDGDGWIAWGAVPTDRPLGASADTWWSRMVGTWCELTKRGCDPARLRARALVTPACGLAGHTPAQAEHALALAEELAGRVNSQAVATRLILGA